jgi:hypothetical protein
MDTWTVRQKAYPAIPEEDQTGLTRWSSPSRARASQAGIRSKNSAECKKGGSFTPPIARKPPPRAEASESRAAAAPRQHRNKRKTRAFAAKSREDSGCWLEQQLRLGRESGRNSGLDRRAATEEEEEDAKPSRLPTTASERRERKKGVLLAMVGCESPDEKPRR